MPEFVCECGAKKGSKEHLKSHICVKHLRWIPFECCHCSANNECTFEATKHDLLIHTNEIHPGQEIKYTYVGDSHKEQLLKRKLQRSKTLVIDQNVPASDHPILIAPTTADTQSTTDVTHSTREALPIETTGLKKNVALNSMANVQSKTGGIDGDNYQLIEADEQGTAKPKINYDSDDSGDDFEPDFVPCLPCGSSVHSERQPPAKSPTPEPEVKPELIVGDDDDFKPDPPASNMNDVGHCSPEDSEDGDGSSPISGTKRNKLKRNRKLKKAHGPPITSTPGYCVTCKRHYVAIGRHLSAKLSSPVYKCSQCSFSSLSLRAIKVHIIRVCGLGANAVRIRSKVDVAAEMQQLKQIHVGAAPRDWPYRCTECKIGITNVSYHILKHHLKLEEYKCPVCGLSGIRRAIQAHMQKKHIKQSQPIWNQTKFREQIRVIQDAVIVINE